jgi:hypothetical protein
MAWRIACVCAECGIMQILRIEMRCRPLMFRMQVYSHEADCTSPADTLDMSVGGVLTAFGGTLGVGPTEAVLTIGDSM